MTPSTLSGFISHARDKGMDHQTIRMLLLSAGWKEKDIAAALASETLTMPVPVPSDVGSARDAFLHLLAFATLYTTVISMIVLVFQYIDRLFPDVTSVNYYYDSSSSVIRWSMASIIVAFPLFLYVSRILYKECAAHYEKLTSGVRRWLTYLTLFVTAMTMTIDVITLIFFLLDGELTTRFLLKVIAVFVLTGIPFLYYFTTLKMEPEHYAMRGFHLRFRWMSIAIVLAAFVAGFFIVGSPSYGRDQRLDERRLQDLRSIQSEVYNYVYGSTAWNVPHERVQQNDLPESLQVVADNAQYKRLTLNDPETGVPYEYRIVGDGFELCANFALVRNQDFDLQWNHPAGNHCFDFALDDEPK